MKHPGTYNANPLSAAAGIACLALVATGEPNRVADARAEELRAGLRQLLARRGQPSWVNGESSVFHVVLAEEGFKPPGDPADLFPTRPRAGGRTRCARRCSWRAST